MSGQLEGTGPAETVALALRGWVQRGERDRVLGFAVDLTQAGVMEEVVVAMAETGTGASHITYRRRAEELLDWLGSLPPADPVLDVFDSVNLDLPRDQSLLPPRERGRLKPEPVSFDPMTIAGLTAAAAQDAVWATVVLARRLFPQAGGRWRTEAAFSSGDGERTASWDLGGDLAAVLNALERCGWETIGTEVTERALVGQYGAEQSIALATRIVARRRGTARQPTST